MALIDRLREIKMGERFRACQVSGLI